MELDERAFKAALAAYDKNKPLVYGRFEPAVRSAITAYEQARERAAVPSVDELADDIEGHWLTRTAQAEFILNKYILPLAQRPAPSAQPWTREQREAAYRAAIAIHPNYQINHYAAVAKDAMRRAVDAALDAVAAPVASAQGEDDFDARADALLKRMESHEAGTYKALQRDLAAERAAHEATSERLLLRVDEAIGAGTKLAHRLDKERTRAEAAEKRAAELERERDEVRAKLDSVREACTPTDDEHAAYGYLYHGTAGRNAQEAIAGYWRRIQSALAQESAKPAEPKPGDVLSGEAATPDLDLAGRVGRLEKFARHVLEAFGKLTTEHGDSVATLFGDTSLADALKALEGK